MIFVYSTFPSRKEAKRIGEALVKRRLVGCVNVFPIDSVFAWKGKIAREKEVAAIIKTEKKNFKKIAKKLDLEDVGEATFGDKSCQDCGTALRFGKDEREYTWSYCPKCRKRISTVLIPRFQPPIPVTPHDD